MLAARTSNGPYEEGLELSKRGQHAEAIERFEQALAAEPNDLRVLFALGNTARMLGLAGPAESFFRRVLALEPGRIEALVNLANLLRANGDQRAALALLEPALARSPDSPELWLTLGSAFRELGERGQAEAHYREALRLDPNLPPALGNLADLMADSGEDEAALAFYDRAIARDRENSQLRLNRAMLHLSHGRLKVGWRDYAARLKLEGKAPISSHGLKPWTGASLNRTRLFVTAEQGVGDELMFASVLPELSARARNEGGAVLLECDSRLVALFSRSFPDMVVGPSRIERRGGAIVADHAWIKSAGGANCACELGSLPRYLRGDVASFPNPHAYLRFDREEMVRWRGAFGARPAIGICWRSGKLSGARALHYAPLEVWARLLAGIAGTVVCVQYDARPDEIAQLESLSGRKIIVPENIDQKIELDRAATLLGALDAVVSAPTAVSWLAAGAGVPTYKVLYDSSWTSFGCDYEPFAPSCLCISPKTAGDWADVFGTLAVLLRERHAAAS